MISMRVYPAFDDSLPVAGERGRMASASSGLVSVIVHRNVIVRIGDAASDWIKRRQRGKITTGLEKAIVIAESLLDCG